MTRADIKEDLSSFTQAVDKIKDGNLNATLITAGVPTASITELANGHDIRHRAADRRGDRGSCRKSSPTTPLFATGRTTSRSATAIR
jgi:hypothetical protein